MVTESKAKLYNWTTTDMVWTDCIKLKEAKWAKLYKEEEEDV